MAWVQIVQDDIVNSLTSQEQSLMADPSSATDMANIVVSVTNLVRGKVQSYQPNQTALPYPPGMIPEELMAAAIAICRYKFLTHLPSTQLITKWREQENTEAYNLLEQVANGDFIILSPATADNPFGTVPQKKADTGGEPFFPPYPYGPWPKPTFDPGYW